MRSPSSPELGCCRKEGGGGLRPRRTERAQAGCCGTQAKIGGDRDSTRPQRFREGFSNRKAKTGGRNYDDRFSVLFLGKEAALRACRQTSVAGNLLTEGICGSRWSHVIWGRTTMTYIGARRFTWTRF